MEIMTTIGDVLSFEEADVSMRTKTAAQCVELSLSNVSIWMGDRQRKHCAQLPGEEIGGTLISPKLCIVKLGALAREGSRRHYRKA